MVAVVIPYRPEDEELAKQTLVPHMNLAGIECKVILAHDNAKFGWVRMHNEHAAMLDFDYYCYSCADYLPEQDYLKLAIDKLIGAGAGLCAFNDGKWDGEVASVGVVTRSYYNAHGLFHPGYTSHGADNEITDKARLNGAYTYEPKAILREIDGRRERENKVYNKEDQALYFARLGGSLM